MRRPFQIAVLALATLVATLAPRPVFAAAAADAGSARPILQPVPRAIMVERSTRPYEEYWMPVGRLTGEGQAEKYEALGGRWTHSTFLTAAGHSVAEVLRHYEQQIAEHEFEVVYSCKGIECGEGGRKTNGDWWPLSDHRGFLVARQHRAAGDLWVSVHVHARLPKAPVQQELDVVQTKASAPPPPPRDERDVATLEKELRADGRVVLQSLDFDERRPAVAPGSEDVVRAVAELLSRDPDLKLYVVVHDDDSRATRESLNLTKKRAAALVKLLTREFDVSAKRLEAVGLGPYSPVATNATEEGRAMNRRVVLIQQGLGRSDVSAARVGEESSR